MLEAGLHAAAPVLCVREIAPMIECLVNKLGFTLENSVGDPTAWASLVRDDVEIMLLAGDYPAPAQDWSVYIYVEDADDLYDELVINGADIKSPPTDKPYHNREFEVRLPDGRTIAFGGPIPEDEL